MENSREFDRVVHGYRPEFRVRHRSGIGTQAKDRSVLSGERLRECRAVREVSVHNLVQPGMRNVELPANDRRRRLDGGMLERIAKGVSTDHSRRAHQYKACLIPRRNVHPRPRGAANVIIEAIWLAGVMQVCLDEFPGSGAIRGFTGRDSSVVAHELFSLFDSSSHARAVTREWPVVLVLVGIYPRVPTNLQQFFFTDMETTLLMGFRFEMLSADRKSVGAENSAPERRTRTVPSNDPNVKCSSDGTEISGLGDQTFGKELAESAMCR